MKRQARLSDETTTSGIERMDKATVSRFCPQSTSITLMRRLQGGERRRTKDAADVVTWFTHLKSKKYTQYTRHGEFESEINLIAPFALQGPHACHFLCSPQVMLYQS